MARRRAVVLAAALVVLAACGRVPDGSGPAAGGPVTIVFKHAHIFGPSDPIPALIREFEAAHPGVRVKNETLPATSDDQHQVYVINLEGRSAGFDVMMLDVIWVPEFARAGWLLDLTAQVSASDLAGYFPSAVEAAQWDARVWALPWNMNVGLLYYRKDLLARHGVAAPATWDELVAAVRRVREGERDPKLEGYVWQGKQYEGLVCNVLEALWGNDTELLGAHDTVFPDVARAADALAYLRGLLASRVSPSWVTAADEELSRRAFTGGHAVFLRNWPYVREMLEASDSAVRGRVGIAPIPGRTAALAGRGSTGGAHLGVARHTRHPAEALAFARFLTSERAQRAMVAGNLYPALMSLYRAPDLVPERPWLPEMADLMLKGRPRPITPNYLLVSTTLQPSFSAALVGVTPVARALDDSRRRLDYFLASRR
jgi:multiple sugar transport system substrate-binding protein